ncbi:MAG TPA: glycerophosphodiester phosphodiesterase [Chloroflexi bacterium]|nr:glycerophosphodiester phosphodiesterase [Chloroflexota bacterium]
MAEFPASWWRAERPLVFAHRGVNRLAPENTLAAFRKAAELGIDGVELDVHISADGVPVVIHDFRVDKLTDGTGWVGALTLAELKALDAGAHFGPEFAGERIPTLEEVFAELGQQLLFNVELKPSRQENNLGKTVVELARWMGMFGRMWISSFKPYSLQVVRSVAPTLPCGLLYNATTWTTRMLAPITPHDALHPHYKLLRERSVRRAHERGLRVAAWTVDDTETAAQLADWGVDVLISNEPQALLTALANR